MSPSPTSPIERQIQEAVNAIESLRSQKVGGNKILERLQVWKGPGKQCFRKRVLFEALHRLAYEVDLVHHDPDCEVEDCAMEDRLVVSTWPIGHEEPLPKPKLSIVVSTKKPTQPKQPHRQHGKVVGLKHVAR